jgi:predicted nucleotide-binding protein (sugar kinase/HSP70/actin superfamily)
MYNTVERVQFTKEMKADYTILMPDMAPIHFALLNNAFIQEGYKMELLKNGGQEVVDTGLKYVHNDTCYPALLVIGQMIHALQSGNYDLNRVALIITQTGGGCRASNYIHLLRKALQNAELGHVPVISLNFSGLEKNSGFSLSVPLARKCLASLAYGDMLMLLRNQVRPYELKAGESDALLELWINRLAEKFGQGKALSHRSIKHEMQQMAAEFADIQVNRTPKVKVGIVGEIYVKYSALANNSLEEFLHSQDCEVMLPGLLSFCLYCVFNSIEDYKLYGSGRIKRDINAVALAYLGSYEKLIIDVIKEQGVFRAPIRFKHLTELGAEVIGLGCKMGEGWVLTAEMMELIEHGFENIICTQPFGCLPNHIIGKGMIRKLKELHPNSNIVPIDYDPGATRVNQENRIKLMLAIAKENL